MLDTRTLLGFFLMVSLTVAANVMLKVGAMDPPGTRFVLGLFGWKSLVGLCLFGCGGLIYGIALRTVPLNVAQVFTASQFIGVILAARLVLSEPISPAQWIGIAFTCAGIILMGLTHRG